MTWLIFDALIVLVFVIFCIMGSVRGFVKMAMRIFGKLAALLIAFMFGDKVAAIINEQYVGPYFIGVFDKYLSGIAASGADELKNLPPLLKSAASLVGYDIDTLVAEIQSAETLGPVVESLASPIANMVSSIIAFALLFVGVLIATWIVKLILNALAKLPVISTVNKWLGFILGAVEGVLAVFVIVLVINAVFPYLQAENILGLESVSLESTYIFKFVSKINPLNVIFG